ncbi:MAG: hypothetical protein MZU97_27335 [Bacillus subtilis]|nr:hypothetical protein [Bacillus subtilis]
MPGFLHLRRSISTSRRACWKSRRRPSSRRRSPRGTTSGASAGVAHSTGRFELAEGLDTVNAKASYKNGVLELAMLQEGQGRGSSVQDQGQRRTIESLSKKKKAN